jgi:hypothetical protein
MFILCRGYIFFYTRFKMYYMPYWNLLSGRGGVMFASHRRLLFWFWRKYANQVPCWKVFGSRF